MTDQRPFEELKDFFENRPVCRKASEPLRQSVEIGIVINDSLNCTFFKDGDRPRLEAREPKKPDVVFFMKPEAVRSLVENQSDDVIELKISIAARIIWQVRFISKSKDR